MSEPEPLGASQIDVELMRQIDAVCRRFEADWRAGARPAIIDLTWPRFPTRARPALRAELEALERELRPGRRSHRENLFGLRGADRAPASRRPIHSGMASPSVHEDATVAPGR